MRSRLLVPVLATAIISTALAQNERLLFGMTLDGGKTFDRCVSANGGSPVLEVAASDGGILPFIFPTGKTVLEPLTIEVGADAPSVYRWIQNSFDRVTALSGAVDTLANSGGKTTTVTEFSNALLTEVDFPALDATAKDAAKMTIKIQPETTKTTLRKGWDGTIKGRVQNLWSRSHFTLHIDGIDNGSTSGLIVISGVSVGYTYAKKAAIMDNQRITVPTVSTGPYLEWLNSSTDSTGAASLREGSITYFSTDGTAIGTLQLHGLGIAGVVPADIDGDNGPTSTVRLYVSHGVSWLPAVQ